MKSEVFFMQSIFKKEIDMCNLTAHTYTYHIIIFFLNLYTVAVISLMSYWGFHPAIE